MNSAVLLLNLEMISYSNIQTHNYAKIIIYFILLFKGALLKNRVILSVSYLVPFFQDIRLTSNLCNYFKRV